MKKISKIKRLLSFMHCSHCGAEFEFEDISPVRFQDEMMVFKFDCKRCAHCFSVGIFGLNSEQLDKTFDFNQEEPKPISYDDVLAAHKFFENLDENWKKFVNQG